MLSRVTVVVMVGVLVAAPMIAVTGAAATTPANAGDSSVQAAQTATNTTQASNTTAEAQATDQPVLNGYFTPQLDGQLYGHTGESIPDSSVGEWADATEQSVVLSDALGERSFDATLHTKVIPPTGEGSAYSMDYIGTRVTGVDWGPGSDEPVQQVQVTIDRDGDGAHSAGDVRLSTGQTFVDQHGPQRLPYPVSEASVFRNGEFVPVDTARFDVDSLGSVAIDGSADGTALESEIESGRIDATLDGGDSEGTGYDIDIETERDRFSIDTDGGYSLEGITVDQSEIISEIDQVNPLAGIDFADLDPGSIELFQAIEVREDGYDLVRNKQTLARLPVDHDASTDVPVEVMFRAYDVSPPGGAPQQLGVRTVSFDAPPGSVDPTNLDDVATLELPDSWTNVERLLLVAAVSSPDYVDSDTSDNQVSVFQDFVETYNMSVYRTRLNYYMTDTERDRFSEGDIIRQPTTWNRDRVSAGFTNTFPIASPEFADVGWEMVGLQNGSQRGNIIDDLDATGEQLQAAWLLATALGANLNTPPPDQMYGLARIRGLSDPKWANGDSLAALGSGFRVTMAHEIDHNIGNTTWGIHVSNTSSEFQNGITYGCGAGGSDSAWANQFNDHSTHIRGWNPGNGLIGTASGTDFMSYCSPRWTSDYRWPHLVERMKNFQAVEPIHPDLQSVDTHNLPPSGTDVLGQEMPTIRLIRGSVSADGGGSLQPSFEQPGALAEGEDPGDASGRYSLVIHRTTGETDEILVDAGFESVDGHHPEEDGFSVPVRDNGTIEAVELVDRSTEEVLAALEGTDFGLEAPSVETPAAFERHQPTPVELNLNAFGTDRQLHTKVLYSPDPDSGLWMPYGQSRTGQQFTATFTETPGGENARFLVLVSDGLRTEFVTSEPFAVSKLDPSITIEENDRYAAEGAGEATPPEPGEQPEVQRLSSTIEANAGEVLSVDARVQTPIGTVGEGTRVRWEFVDQQGTVLASDTGERGTIQVGSPGEYTLQATVTDLATGQTDTDTIPVQVSHPPLPNATIIDAFESAKSSGTTSGPSIELAPQSTTVSLDGTTSLDVVVDGIDNGVGAYNLTLSTNGEFAQIVDVSNELSIASDIESIERITPDGSAATIAYSIGDSADTGPVTVATVTVRGLAVGQTILSIEPTILGDENGAEYTVEGLTNASLEVREITQPTLPGFDSPSNDTDGDQRLEDVNGAGGLDILDVVALYSNLGSQEVTTNGHLFNFNEDPDDQVDILDVVALYSEYQQRQTAG